MGPCLRRTFIGAGPRPPLAVQIIRLALQEHRVLDRLYVMPRHPHQPEERRRQQDLQQQAGGAARAEGAAAGAQRKRRIFAQQRRELARGAAGAVSVAGLDACALRHGYAAALLYTPLRG